MEQLHAYMPLYFHISPVWLDWAIFKDPGYTFLYKSNPNLC